MNDAPVNGEARLAAIGTLFGLGFSIIPVEFRGKRPAVPWKRYQECRATYQDLEDWFGGARAYNVGIVTGSVSGVVVIDCDSPAAIRWADEHLPRTPMITRTAKGEHRFFRHPGRPVRNRARLRTTDARIALDVRADGGYVVAPGSVHESGAVYEAVGGAAAVEDLPVFDPAWLDADAADLGPREVPAIARPQRDEHEPLPRRMRRYLDATPPAIEGQGGDTHTLQVVCRIVRGFDCSDAEALDVLREWNARCVPPWTDAELEAKIANARKYGHEPIGARRGRPAPERGGGAPPAAAPPSGGNGSSAAPLRTFNLTDSGNAEYLAARHGRDLRYDHRRGRWLLWRRHRWQPDQDSEICRLAKDAMRQRYVDAAHLEDLGERTRASKHAISSESKPRLDALRSLAQSEPLIADAGDGWDLDPMLVGAPNGVIDLRTGQLRDGRREDRITRSVAVAYDQTAACPRWERFMAEVFAGDPQLVSFVWRAIGYSLTAETSEQCLFLLYGVGSNGKSTLVRTLMKLFGDYADNMPFSTIEMQQRSSIPNDLAALVGRRFVVAAETNDGTRLNEARVKALTGCDPITARFLHAEFFTFEPVAKFWLSVNHRPIVRDDSHGFWRRIRLIPFTQTFTVDPTLSDDLAAERLGILAWAVRGCLAWQREGLNPPAAVVAATREYEHESDLLADFLDEACEQDAHAEILANDLYEHYKQWAGTHGLTERTWLSRTMFGRKMAERFRRAKTRAGWVYFGLARCNHVTGLDQ